MRFLLALLLSAVLAPAASANPARDLTKTGIPGAVVLSGDRVYDSGNLHAGQRFRVGSVTKTFVSTITLQLVAEGRLKLDQPVPEAGGAPLRTLLNHTSGVFNHSEDPKVFEQGFLKQWQPRELIAISRSHPPYFPAGTGFHYSNTNYVILGELIERTTGRPLERELQRRIIGPLGLRDTSYDEGPRVRGVGPGFARGPGLHRPEHELGGRVRRAGLDRARPRPLLSRAGPRPPARPRAAEGDDDARPGGAGLRPRAVPDQYAVRDAVGPQWPGAGLLRAGLRERGRPPPRRRARQPPTALRAPGGGGPARGRRGVLLVRNEVRNLRTEAKLSQQALAEAMEVSRQTINSIEKERYTPSLPLAIALARYFGKPVEEVFHADT